MKCVMGELILLHLQYVLEKPLSFNRIKIELKIVQLESAKI